MANKTFNTRIQMKYDTYANWTTNNPVPLQGEICVVVVPASSGSVVQEPAILFKVGDGTKTFNELPYISAAAADVYDWAKASTKPSYSAGEISGLSAYISNTIKDTNTQYKIEVDANNNRKFNLYSKEIGGTWALQNTITIPDETVHTLVTGETNGTVKFDGVEVPVKGLGSAAYTDSTAYDTKGSAAAVLGKSTDAATANTVYGAKAAAAAAQGTANSKVASVSKSNEGITIGGTATAPTVGVKISTATTGNILTLKSDGLSVVPPTPPEYSIVKDATATAGYLATYHLTKAGSNVGVAINIPKDYLVKSATMGEVSTADSPYTGAKVGDKFIDFIINTPSNDGTENHIYLPVNDLVDVYTGGNGISISSSNEVALKLSSTTNGLSVSSNGLALAVASKNSSNVYSPGAMSAADKKKLDGISSGAEVNQNAFSNVVVGGTTIAADSKTDTLTLVAGDNITLTPDATNDKITIKSTDTNTTYSISKSGETVTLTGSDGSTSTYKEIRYSTGNASTSGLTKLYTSTGTSTDGTMTRKAITDALALKANSADLATVATSGNVKDLEQTAGEYLIFNCGSSSTVI